MNLTFIEFLAEKKSPVKTKLKQKTGSTNVEIQVADKEDEDIDAYISIKVTYDVYEDHGSRPGDKVVLIPEESTIDYEVNKPFTYKDETYQKGSGIEDLYDEVFFEDEIVSKSSYLQQHIENYYMKPDLSDTKKEEVFIELLNILVEK